MRDDQTVIHDRTHCGANGRTGGSGARPSLWARARARLNRAAGISIETTLLYEMRESAPPPEPAHDPEVTIRRLEAADLPLLAEVGPVERHINAQRLERGHLCYGVWLSGRIAHFSWMQSAGEHALTDAGVSFPVTEHEIWIYDCRTAAWARGRGLYPRALASIVRDQFAHGCKVARIYTTRSNLASQRGILRAGFQPAGALRALRIGSKHVPLSGRKE